MASGESPGQAGNMATRAVITALLGIVWLSFLTTLPATYQVQLNDFPAYYGAATSIADGTPEKLYGTDFKWFTNLPVVALLLRPLALMSYEQAWKFFWWLQVVCFVATFGLLLHHVHRFFAPLTLPKFALASVIFVSFAPLLRRCLVLGQTTPLMMLLFALVLLWVRSGLPRLAGTVLGVICTIKIPPILLIVLLALRRRIAVAVPALAVVLLGVVLSFAVFGSDLVWEFYERVVADNFGRSEAAFNNQSLEGAFMRVFTDRGLADWTTVARPTSVTLSVIGTGLALAALLLLRAPGFLRPNRAGEGAKPSNGAIELEAAIGVCLMLLLFPVVWKHYYLFLAVPITLLPFWWVDRDLPRPGWLVVLLAAGILMASGAESHENTYYAARETDLAFRWAQNRQPIGALMLVIGLSFPLAALAKQHRDA